MSSSHHHKPSASVGSASALSGVGDTSGPLAGGDDRSSHNLEAQQAQPSKSSKKAKEDSVVGTPLVFPAPPPSKERDLAAKAQDKDAPLPEGGWDDPTPLLSALRDDHSHVQLVHKACLQITQWAGGGSQGISQDAGTVWQSHVVHEPTYTRIVSTSLQNLTTCLQEHKDRRCRVASATTLGLLGKAAYARLRPSPLLYAVREASTSVKLEDEIGAEVPSALVAACLQDEDEGVSAAALDALGVLVQSHSTTSTAIPHDDLTRHLQSLTAARVAPYAPTLQALVDEDIGVPATELAARVLENVILPRMLDLVERVLRYTSTRNLALALPVLTTALLHQANTTRLQHWQLDKPSFAKQWAEVDAAGLTRVVVHNLLTPLLQQTLDGHLAQVAALSALRLAGGAAAAEQQEPWITSTCRHVIVVQQEALTSTPLSVPHKMHMVATVLIAARSVPFPERTSVLQPLVEVILALPSTTRAPLGVHCPGLLLNEYANRKHNAVMTSNNISLHHAQPHFGQHYRRPARLNFWTELALHFFVDGPAPTAVDMKTVALNAGTTTPSNTGGRQEALRQFLNLPSLAAILSGDNAASSRSAPLLPRDELLLAFTSVAIACGRRFRGGEATVASSAGGGGAAAHTATSTSTTSAWPVTDPSAQPVEEWLQLSWVVLTAFVPCVNVGRKYTYLEEDLSLTTAGHAQYVQLLQEYLHVAGLLHPGSSVALKLVANACPPHLLWDQLSESAAFMARFEALDMGLLDNTTKLLDEIIVREMQQGIPSHHMRLFLLALASDHWMQGRVAAIRKQFETSASASHSQGSGNTPPNLDVTSARDIILALSPKRVLHKIFHAHIPPVDAEGKKKKDPMKRLALETVRVCVACIENIALIACDWRKRFPTTGNNAAAQEPKHVVSVAVGVLQGKVDETPANETILTIMGPVCEAAVSRIQSFYESDMGGQDSFPASELVMQNVKTKIKPLVSSSSRPPVVSKDDFARGYLMQLCRQLVASRIDQALYSVPPADAELSPARATNWLRLAVPPLPESRDARVLGNRWRDLPSTFGTSVKVVSAGSDPAAVLLAYTPRRYFRHDGEDEYRVTALMRVYNTTNLELDQGVRLELGLVNQGGEFQPQHLPPHDSDYGGTMDALEHAVRAALEMEPGETLIAPLTSASVVCKQELKPGEFLSWEVALDHANVGEGLSLLPSVVFCNVPKEPMDTGAKWVAEKSGGGDASTINTGSAESGTGGGEDDFQVTQQSDNTMGKVKDGDTPSENITMSGDALPLAPLIQFQPCPLVFLRDRIGDIEAFRFLWFRVPYHLPEVPLTKREELPSSVLTPENLMMRTVANLSCLVWNGEAIPGGYVTRAWAFSTLSGKRVLAVLSESDSDKNLALHLRGDDPYVLYGMVGPRRNRTQVVSALVPELAPVILD